MRKIKNLLRPMSFSTLLHEAKREEWDIPMSEDISGVDTQHNLFWIIDVVPAEKYTDEDKKYGVKLAYAFDTKLQERIIMNQKNILMCVVMPKEKDCSKCFWNNMCSIQQQIKEISFSGLEQCDGEDYERYNSKPFCNLFKRK